MSGSRRSWVGAAVWVPRRIVAVESPHPERPADETRQRPFKLEVLIPDRIERLRPYGAPARMLACAHACAACAHARQCACMCGMCAGMCGMCAGMCGMCACMCGMCACTSVFVQMVLRHACLPQLSVAYGSDLPLRSAESIPTAFSKCIRRVPHAPSRFSSASSPSPSFEARRLDGTWVKGEVWGEVRVQVRVQVQVQVQVRVNTSGIGSILSSLTSGFRFGSGSGSGSGSGEYLRHRLYPLEPHVRVQVRFRFRFRFRFG